MGASTSFAATRTVAVIGAGSSGIAGAKCAIDEGVEPTVFEQSGEVGGNWVYQPQESHSSCYRSLYINTSREIMAYSDFPMSESLPDYPHHTHIVRYFDDYVDHFRFRDRIRFRTRVTRVARGAHDGGDGGGWDVTTQGAEGAERTQRFDALFVANGHHWSPRWPDPPFPGADAFTGTQLHSHSYKEPSRFDGQGVVVVGIGNSAVDIAVEVSHVAAQVFLSTRSGAWVVPKYFFGQPIDHVALTRFGSAIPISISAPLTRRRLAAYQGKLESWGLPRPKFDLFQAHPTVSNELLGRIGHGAVMVKPDIERLDGDAVVFVDGSRATADAIVWCTGYDIRFPFFDEALPTVRDNQLDLWKRVFHPDLGASVAFLGLVQPLGAIMPIAEMQARWAARIWAGRAAAPPDRAAMLRDIGEMHEKVARRYHRSARHTIQVDFFAYMDELAERIGVRPRVMKHPSLAKALLIGPASPAQYRLEGPGAWSGAADAIRAAYARSRGTRAASAR